MRNPPLTSTSSLRLSNAFRCQPLSKSSCAAFLLLFSMASSQIKIKKHNKATYHLSSPNLQLCLSQVYPKQTRTKNKSNLSTSSHLSRNIICHHSRFLTRTNEALSVLSRGSSRNPLTPKSVYALFQLSVRFLLCKISNSYNKNKIPLQNQQQ